MPKSSSAEGKASMVFRYALGKALVAAIGALAVIWLGAYYIFRPDTGLRNAAVQMFIGGYFLFAIMLAHIWRSGPIVLISHQGIEDRRLKIGLIRWDEIGMITVAMKPSYNSDVRPSF